MLDVSWVKKVKSDGAVLIVGLPGVGLLGRIAVEFFVSELKPVKVAELFSHSLPSMVVTGKDGVVRALRSDLYYLKGSGGKGKDVFFLLCDAQPALPPQGSFDAQHVFSSELIDFLSGLGVSQVFTIAGLPDEARPFNGFNVTVAVTDKKVFKGLKGEFKVQQPGLPITGAAGLLLYYASRKKMTGACVIGSTNGGNVPDVSASLGVAKVLVDSLKLDVDLVGFEKRSKEFEASLKTAVDKMVPDSWTLSPEQKFQGKYPSYIL